MITRRTVTIAIPPTIIFIIIGGVIGLLAVCVFVGWYMRYRRQARHQQRDVANVTRFSQPTQSVAAAPRPKSQTFELSHSQPPPSQSPPPTLKPESSWSFIIRHAKTRPFAMTVVPPTPIRAFPPRSLSQFRTPRESDRSRSGSVTIRAALLTRLQEMERSSSSSPPYADTTDQTHSGGVRFARSPTYLHPPALAVVSSTGESSATTDASNVGDAIDSAFASKYKHLMARGYTRSDVLLASTDGSDLSRANSWMAGNKLRKGRAYDGGRVGRERQVGGGKGRGMLEVPEPLRIRKEGGMVMGGSGWGWDGERAMGDEMRFGVGGGYRI